MNEQSENCQVCCNSSYKQTKKSSSSDINPYKCGICLRGFPKLSTLTKHVKLDDCRDSAINCNLCNESFDHPSLPLSHLPSQPSPCLMECTRPNKPNNCCNVILNNRNSKQKPCCKNPPLTRRKNQFVSGSNMVNNCFKTSSTTSRRNANGNVSRTRPFKCKICLKTFPKASVLANHTKSHSKDKSFKCDIHSKKFTESANFTRYENNHASGKLFSCNICHKGFSQSSNLTTHKRVHSGERPFQCYICNKAFTESGNLRRHMRIHSGERPFKCDICEKPFSQLSHVAKHKSTHFKMKHFKTKTHSTKNRMKTSNNGANKPIARPGRRRQVSSNVIKMYSPSGKICYKCAICEKVFNESGNLTRHFRTHTGERPFHCSICYKSFSQASHVHKHMKTHNPDKPFSCELCPKSFSDFDSLYEHVKIHSGLDAEEQPKITILNPPNIEETIATAMALEESKDSLEAIKPIILQSEYDIASLPPPDPTNGIIEDTGNQIMVQEPLGQQYPNDDNNLAPELGFQTDSEIPNTPKSSSVFECHICQKTFSQYWFLTRHSKIHLKLKPYKCKTCGKEFTESGNLSRHMRIHSGERPYKCSVCTKAFSQATHLQKHMNTHAEDKSHSCHICQATFRLSADLTKHLKSHSQDKNYQCHVCSKVFTEPGSLSRHMRTHSSSRPYQCDVCDKSFFQSCVLNKHKRIHSEDKPFKCDICKKAFTESGNLTRHYRTHTGEKPYRCSICNKPFSQASHVNKHMRTHSESQYFQQDFTYSALLEEGDAYPNMSLIDEMMAQTEAATIAANQQEVSVTPESLVAQYAGISRHMRFFADDSKMSECTNCNGSFTVSQYTEHIKTCLASAPPNTVKTDADTSEQDQGDCVSGVVVDVTSDAVSTMKAALNNLNGQQEQQNNTKDNIVEAAESSCILDDVTNNDCNGHTGSAAAQIPVKTEAM